jgi:hypothetical protein
MKAKNFAILILSVALVIVLLFKDWHCGGGVKETIKYDTVWVEIKGDTQYIPTIVNHYLPGKVPKALEKWDTLYVIEDIDTAAILQDYFSFNLYSDTLKNKYGYVLVNDTISKNKILGRGVKTDLLVPEVIKTITLTQSKRNQVYVGGAVLGNAKDFLSGVEGNIYLKTKNDKMVGMGYTNIFNNGGYLSLRYSLKLSFKKR